MLAAQPQLISEACNTSPKYTKKKKRKRNVFPKLRTPQAQAQAQAQADCYRQSERLMLVGTVQLFTDTVVTNTQTEGSIVQPFVGPAACIVVADCYCQCSCERCLVTPTTLQVSLSVTRYNVPVINHHI
jgi:hypothetical protein